MYRNYSTASRGFRYRPRFGGRGRGRGRYRSSANRQLARVLKNLPKAELKFVHHGFVDEPSQGNSSQRLISDVSQGAAGSDRVGNWIQPVSLSGYITVTGDADGSTAPNYGVRVGFCQWFNDESRDSFTTTEVMLDVMRPGGPFNVRARGSFRVLWSRYFIVYNNGENAKITHTERYFLKLKQSPKCLYNVDLQKANQIFWFCLSDDRDGTAPPTVEVDAMFRFTDA